MIPAAPQKPCSDGRASPTRSSSRTAARSAARRAAPPRAAGRAVACARRTRRRRRRSRRRPASRRPRPAPCAAAASSSTRRCIASLAAENPPWNACTIVTTTGMTTRRRRRRRRDEAARDPGRPVGHCVASHPVCRHFRHGRVLGRERARQRAELQYRLAWADTPREHVQVVSHGRPLRVETFGVRCRASAQPGGCRAAPKSWSPGSPAFLDPTTATFWIVTPRTAATVDNVVSGHRFHDASRGRPAGLGPRICSLKPSNERACLVRSAARNDRPVAVAKSSTNSHCAGSPARSAARRPAGNRDAA